MKIFKTFLLALISIYAILIGINQFQTVSQSKIDAENEKIETIINNDEPIVCILKANKRKYKIGEKPDIEVQIINKTDSTITLIGSLDGSSEGVRTPLSQFTVRHQMFGEKERSYSRCFRTNPIRLLDYKEVKSGEIFNPYEKIDDYGFFPDYLLYGTTFQLPGVYTITYQYSTNPADIHSFFENDDEIEVIDSSSSFEDLRIDSVYYEQILSYNRMMDSFFNQLPRIPEVQLKSNNITIEYDF